MAYKGNAHEFKELIQPVLDKMGKHLCRYPSEEEKVQDARTLPQSIVKEDWLLEILHGESNALLYPKAIVEGALNIIVKEQQTKWQFDANDAKDWVTTMTRRIRNLARVVGQPLSKNRTPVWMKKLKFHLKMKTLEISGDHPVGSDAENGSADEADNAENGSADEADSDNAPLANSMPEWIVKFDKELMLATRSKKQGGKVELSMPILDFASMSPNDMVKATFTIGGVTVHEVPGLTFGNLRLLMRNNHNKGIGRIWQGEHKTTHHAIFIEQRVDRCLLLSLFEQSKQRLQLRMDMFGEVANQSQQLPKDDPTLAKAVAFMIPIAQKFESGELDHSELKEHRDECLRTHGMSGTKKRPSITAGRATGGSAKEPVTKRPAMQVQTDTSTQAVVAQPTTPVALRRTASKPTHALIAGFSEMSPPPKSTMEKFLEY
jgi:hypothetical protein